MTREMLLEELRAVVEQLGYTLRFERGDFNGGACVLRDQRLLVINKRFTLDRKLATIARAIGAIGIDDVFLKPAVRTFIEDELHKAAS